MFSSIGLGNSVVEHALLFLKAPSNIEKQVRVIRTLLYRERNLTSALALPVMIPLCFVPPQWSSRKRAERREAMFRAVGKTAPLLRSGSILRVENALMWELEPAEDLERLKLSCEQAFCVEESAERTASGLFPVARGFYLGSSAHEASAPPPAPEPLRFPALAAILLHVHGLKLQREAINGEAAGAPAADAAPWWRSVFWEQVERIPLRKG